MNEPLFEYDLFISFASGDEDLVRPLWQDLTSSGLRVFWSDATLRELAGSSWFDVIERSLERSRHLLLVCTPKSLASKWVKREYVAFLNHCHRPPARLLVPVLVSPVQPMDLPLFLKEIEACSLQDDSLLKHLVRLFGGVDVNALLLKVAELDEELLTVRAERDALTLQVNAVRERLRDDHDAQDLMRTRRELQAIRQDRDSSLMQVARLREELNTATRQNSDYLRVVDAASAERAALQVDLQHGRDAARRCEIVEQELSAAKVRVDELRRELEAESQRVRFCEINHVRLGSDSTTGETHGSKLISPLDFSAYAGEFLKPQPK